MLTCCIGDLHLHDEDQPFLFTDAKERVFVALANEVHRRGGALVLTGDTFELTGMSSPAMGLGDFFRDAVPKELGSALRANVPARSAAFRIESLRRRFPAFFAALAPLAQASRLTLLPGNHDCELGVASARAALAVEIGVRAEQIRFAPHHREGDFLVAAHGHEFDDSNQTAKGCQNRGAAMTHALFAAVMPALRALGVPAETVAAVPAVRPEENLVHGLARLLGPERTSAVLRALVELLRKNRYFEGLGNIEAWLAARDFTATLTPEEVREALADDGDIKVGARRAAQKIIDGEPLLGAGARPRVVVMGHTHELDALSNYVNLGTWVDHVRGLSPADLVRADRSLPFLLVDEGQATLRDAARLTSGRSLEAAPVLWRYRASGD